MIGVPILTELPKYLDKMMVLATFGLLDMTPVEVSSFLEDGFLLSKDFLWWFNCFTYYHHLQGGGQLSIVYD